MAASSLTALDDLQDIASEVCRSIQKAKRSLAGQVKRQQETLDCRMSETIYLTAALIAAIALDPRVGFWFVLWHSRSPKFRPSENPEMQEQEVIGKIKAVSELPAVAQILADEASTLRVKAVRWLAEWRTFVWLVSLNVKGIAPSSADVGSWYRAHFPADHERLVQDHLHALETNKQALKKWMNQFRKRWSLRHASLPVAPALADEEIRRKVGSPGEAKKFPRLDPHFWGLVRPKSGTPFCV